MPKTNTIVYTNSKYYQDIADAIRIKNGTENTYTPRQMAQAILALEAETNPTISEITISSSGVVSQQLQPDTIYHFTSTALTDLTLTFASVTSTAQYHFDFISPSTAVNLTLPQSVNMPSNFTVEANTRYEIDVINNYGVFAEWVYEVS